jgi:ankyrin repeat protein
MMFLEDFAESIKGGDLSRVETLLSNGSVDANARLPWPLNPPALVFAAGLTGESGEQEHIVDALLRFGARIDDTDDEGRTACHAAAQGDVAAVLALLLAHQPNLELKCGKGNTSLATALEWSRFTTSTMLLEAGASLDAVDPRMLCRLAAESTSAIKTLRRRGVVVSELIDHQGRTPLHLSTLVGEAFSVAVLDMLVNECGVNLEVHNMWGFTCTHIAMLQKHVDAVRFFVAAGADLESLDKSKGTPLHIMGDERCTILLLAGGSNVHARDERGRTPCHVASLYFARDLITMRSIVNMMLAAGADLDVADVNGNTARQLLANRQLRFEDAAKQVEAARRAIHKVRLDFVRHRASQVCIGLQSRGLDALQMCEILVHSCGPLAPLIEFHQWWAIATTVKHFQSKN